MKQSSLFDIENEIALTPKTLNDIALLENIKGLTYIPEYISVAQEKELWQAVNAEKWLDDLKRRVQHYGYKYDYKARFINYSMKIGDLPAWALTVGERLKMENYFQELPDQLIVNEYIAGQGIANHVDCQPCFGETIISLSMGSACIMDFVHKYTSQKIEVLLEPRSLVVLKDEARNDWTHGIQGKKTDIFNGQKYERGTRISLTFRNVILK